MFFRWLVFSFNVLRFLWRFFVGLMHFLMVLSFLATLLVIGLAFSFNLWFPLAARWYVAHQSGFRLTIGASNSTLSRGLIDFSAIEIKNPKGKFSQDDCLKINRLMVKANLLTIFNPNVIFEEATIDVESITCDTNGNGVINVLDLARAFGISESGDFERDPQSDRSRKKHLVKMAPNQAGNGESLKLFAIREGGQCVVQEMVIYLGKLKLHNIIPGGGTKEIDIHETWNFTDVHSRKEVIKAIRVRLRPYGIDLVVQSAFGAIFNLPGVSSAKHLLMGVSHFSQTLFKGIAESVTKALPSKDDINLDANSSKAINRQDYDPLRASRNINKLEKEEKDAM
jgi:hypothetical protein